MLKAYEPRKNNQIWRAKRFWNTPGEIWSHVENKPKLPHAQRGPGVSFLMRRRSCSLCHAVIIFIEQTNNFQIIYFKTAHNCKKVNISLMKCSQTTSNKKSEEVTAYTCSLAAVCYPSEDGNIHYLCEMKLGMHALKLTPVLWATSLPAAFSLLCGSSFPSVCMSTRSPARTPVLLSSPMSFSTQINMCSPKHNFFYQRDLVRILVEYVHSPLLQITLSVWVSAAIHDQDAKMRGNKEEEMFDG